MKAAHVRIEITKGDGTKEKPWKRVVRVIERDRAMTVTSNDFTNTAELHQVLASMQASPRTTGHLPWDR